MGAVRDGGGSNNRCAWARVVAVDTGSGGEGGEGRASAGCVSSSNMRPPRVAAITPRPRVVIAADVNVDAPAP